MSSSLSSTAKVTVLLVLQREEATSGIRDTLVSDGYNVIGPVDNLTAAYMALLDEDPSLAVIDEKICLDQTEIMSDTLIQIGIEHLVICHTPPHMLKRELGHGAMRGLVTAPHKNIVEDISHELCYMRAKKLRRDAQSNGKIDRIQNAPVY